MAKGNLQLEEICISSSEPRTENPPVHLTREATADQMEVTVVALQEQPPPLAMAQRRTPGLG